LRLFAQVAEVRIDDWRTNGFSIRMPNHLTDSLDKFARRFTVAREWLGPAGKLEEEAIKSLHTQNQCYF
jgi:hypothetical protein